MGLHHFYTTDASGELALKVGYKYTGIACYVYNTQVKGTIPVYRAYDQITFNHFYTTDRAEFDRALQPSGSYTAESVGWYMFNKDQTDIPTIALYRYYDTVSQDHLFSTDSTASDFQGYTAEGPHGYVLADNKHCTDYIRPVPLYSWTFDH